MTWWVQAQPILTVSALCVQVMTVVQYFLCIRKDKQHKHKTHITHTHTELLTRLGSANGLSKFTSWVTVCAQPDSKNSWLRNPVTCKNSMCQLWWSGIPKWGVGWLCWLLFSLRHHEKSAANLGSWPLEDRPTHSRSESVPTNWTRLHSSNDVHRYHLRKGPEVRLCVGELCLANDLMFFHLCSLVELSYGGYLQGMWIQSLYWFTANEWILRHKPCTFGSHRQTVVNMINDGVNQSFVK